MTTKHKTIFLINFHFLASRNILTTEVFGELIKEPNLKVVILVPDHKKDFFEKNYQNEKVVIEGFNVDTPLFRDHRSFRVGKFLTQTLQPTYAIRLRLREKLRRQKLIRNYFQLLLNQILAPILGRCGWLIKLGRWLDQKTSPHYMLDYYFDKYRPQAIFTTDIFSDTDFLFIQAARARNILSIGMVRSWDNASTKGLLRTVPDKIISNNEIIADEIVKLHFVNKNNIFIVLIHINA